MSRHPNLIQLESQFVADLIQAIRRLKREQSSQVDADMANYTAELEAVFEWEGSEVWEAFAAAYDGVVEHGRSERRAQVDLHTRAMTALIRHKLERFLVRVWWTRANGRNRFKRILMSKLSLIQLFMDKFIQLQKDLVLVRSSLKVFLHEQKDALIHPQVYYGHQTELRNQHRAYKVRVQQLPYADRNLALLQELHRRQWENFDQLGEAILSDNTALYNDHTIYIYKFLVKFEASPMRVQLAREQYLFWWLYQARLRMKRAVDGILGQADSTLENRRRVYHDMEVAFINRHMG